MSVLWWCWLGFFVARPPLFYGKAVFWLWLPLPKQRVRRTEGYDSIVLVKRLTLCKYGISFVTWPRSVLSLVFAWFCLPPAPPFDTPPRPHLTPPKIKNHPVLLCFSFLAALFCHPSRPCFDTPKGPVLTPHRALF